MSQRPTYITDANIWIDLHFGDLIEAALSLPFRFLVPDVALEELIVPEGKRLLALGLEIYAFAPNQVKKVLQLREAQQYRKLSTNDLFVLVAAEDSGFDLITNDRALRRAAEKKKITVKGSLWLLDELVRVVEPKRLVLGLTRMIQSGSRLPEAECQKRLRLWGGKT